METKARATGISGKAHMRFVVVVRPLAPLARRAMT